MNKATAEKIKLRGETAIRELVAILEVDKIQADCTEEEFEAIKRAIGLSIGRIDTELLVVAYQQFPELDPIKKNQ